MARTIAGFFATLAVLGLAYGALVAVNSRVKLDLGAGQEAPQDGSHVVAATAALLALDPEDVGRGERDVPFVPSGRRLRESTLRDGAAEVAARVVMLVAPVHGRADAALAEARAALTNGASSEDAGRAVARDALIRLNAHIARGQTRLDTRATALGVLLRAAAASCEGRSAELAALAAKPSLLAPPGADARMYQARGVAYGWLLIIRAALRDAPELADAQNVEAKIPIEALARAASRQPLLYFNGDASMPWAPAHVSDAAADFARAAAGARALAAAVEQPGD